MRRRFKEIIGWLAFLAILYFGLLGGQLSDFVGSTPSASSDSTTIGIPEPSADLGAAVDEPTPDEVAAATAPATNVVSNVEPHAASGETTNTATRLGAVSTEPSPWTSMPTLILVVLVVAASIVLVGFAFVAWFLWKHRRPNLVTPEGVQMEIEHQPTTTAPRRAPIVRPSANAHRSPQLPALVPPVVEQLYSQLAPAGTLAAYRALGHTPQPDELLPNRHVRILELMVAFRATRAAIAHDESVLVLPGLALPNETITRIAAPQPAVLTADQHGPIVVVGLWQPANNITSSTLMIEPVQAAPATPTTRSDRTTQLIPAIPPHVPFPRADQIGLLTHGKLPILLAVQGPQGLEQRWIRRSVFSGHWGIAGKSQRGKGNFLRYILLNLLTLPPAQLQAVVIDLKGGADFGFILKLRHARLYTPRDADGQCIGDGDLTEGLTVALNEMARRNRLFIEAGVRTIEQYNAKVSGPALPWMLVIVDEAFDLPNDLKTKLHSLVARSISAGIIVFVSTQHPANVLSTQIRGNYSTYVAFRVEAGRNYVEAALGLAQGGDSLYDPSAIPDTPGIAVIRFDGQEHLGRVPEITDDLQDQLAQQLAAQYPRIVVPSPAPEQATRTEQPALMLVSSEQGNPAAPEIDLTRMTAAELVQALADDQSPAGAVLHRWLHEIGHFPAAPAAPDDAAAAEPDVRPYDLVADDSPHRITLKDCAAHPVVVATVLRIYNELKARLGFQQLSGRSITAIVFERVPGSKDGWTSSRWTQVVKPILIHHNLALPTQDDPVSVSGTTTDRGGESEQRAA